MATDTAGGQVLDAQEGEALWFFGTLTLVKGEGAYTIVEQRCPRGMTTPLHVQPDDDEAFHVVEGRASFHVNGEWHEGSTGSTAFVPRGTPHAFRADSDDTRVLIVTTPQHMAFFRAAGEPAAERRLPDPAPPDMEKLMSAAQQFGVEILGPPPD